MPPGLKRLSWRETQSQQQIWKDITGIMSEETSTAEGRISFSCIPGRLYPSIPTAHLGAIYLSAPHRHLPVGACTAFAAIMQRGFDRKIVLLPLCAILFHSSIWHAAILLSFECTRGRIFIIDKMLDIGGRVLTRKYITEAAFSPGLPGQAR